MTKLNKFLSENDDHNFDSYDMQILDVLSEDGRIKITDLAKKVGLSKTPVQARVKRLEEKGIITGYRAMIDPIALKLDHVAFIEIKLRDTREAALAAFNEAVMSIAEIEEVHLIAGNFDYLLKVRTRNMSAYRTVLAEKISTLPQVSHTSTYVAMQAVKEFSNDSFF